MIIQVLYGPNCQGTAMVRHGTTRHGKQRDDCRETSCHKRTFLVDAMYADHSAEGKPQIADMARPASGSRDTARG